MCKIPSENDDITCGYEFKYLDKFSPLSKSGKQSILNDLLRLYYYKTHTSNSRAFFLIAGSQLNFLKSFQDTDKIRYNSYKELADNSQKQKTEFKIPRNDFSAGFYEKWFSFTPKEPEVVIDLNSEANKEFKDSFFEDYNTPFKSQMENKGDLVVPDKIVTRRIFISDNHNVNSLISSSMKVGIWEVISNNKFQGEKAH